MKKIISGEKFTMALFIGLIITGIAMQYIYTVKADIAKSFVRLHVIANSNSQSDQDLKLKVRDSIVEHLKDKLKEANSTEETKSIIKKELESIAKAAQEEIFANDYNYAVTVSLGNYRFPTRSYEGAMLPAGNYDALRIIIGEGMGENWWCVLYPQLCFTSSQSGTLPEESRQKLKNVLTEDEFNIIAGAKDGSMPVKIKFRLLEIFGRGE